MTLKLWARSILRAFVVPKLILLFTAAGWSTQTCCITYEQNQSNLTNESAFSASQDQRGEEENELLRKTTLTKFGGRTHKLLWTIDHHIFSLRLFSPRGYEPRNTSSGVEQSATAQHQQSILHLFYLKTYLIRFTATKPIQFKYYYCVGKYLFLLTSYAGVISS